MLHPTSFNTSQICHQLGVKHAVLSPGSRNAPLTLSFARHDEIQKWIIPDERSAGFIALGIAQETKSPVVLCCTSGTALLNYAPAVAEAYYRHIPLVILSADRPPELIDQRDGQTIRQFEALQNHVKVSLQLPIINSKKEASDYQEMLIQSIKESMVLPSGPIHLNIPFSEPFYPSNDVPLHFSKVQIATVSKPAVRTQIPTIPKAKKILILVGQDEPNETTQKLIEQVSEKIPVVRSPLNNLKKGIEHVDGFIGNQSELVPELLITSGLSVLSKKLKIFIRKHKPRAHIHFDEAGVPVDTYQTNPTLYRTSLENCLKDLHLDSVDVSFRSRWMQYDLMTRKVIDEFFDECQFSEAKASYQILKQLPENSSLHLSNSMPVRYVDLFGVKPGILSRSNRGTSGIDGCTSTALGNALVSHKIHFFITGDLAFLYDRNAFFHNYQASNLKVIVMNNRGGGIFRLIQGPSQLPELDEYFETRHNRTSKYICKENNLDYYPISSEEELSKYWVNFVTHSDNTSVMEIFSEPRINQTVYKNLRNHINERINSLE